MFDNSLRSGAVCDRVEMRGRRPGRFRVGVSTWHVTGVEAVWREWWLGEGSGRGRDETGADLEMWRVHAAPAGGVRDVIVVLARDLATGRWSVHTVWD